ncbi:MAG: Nif11-like leader peptide family natural product precursor [Ruminiclostridium sp.]|nr:Nif11-like leader peptide family natural product precursor [Ruminiclostridium sp.]
MSKEIAKKLIAELQTNTELKAKIAGIEDKDELVKIAVQNGYDVTVEEMLEAEREFKEQIAQKTDAQSVELSADELESAAGGAHWQGEDAPDGKELGCEICNYKYDEMKEKNYWCKNDWYCNGTRGKYEPDCYNKGSHMGN